MIQNNIFQLDENSVYPHVNNEQNLVVHSRLSSYDSFEKDSKLSIKLVTAGVEHYQLNNEKYQLFPGEFLLVEEHSKLRVAFDEKKDVEGFCFFIDEVYLKQALALSRHGERWGLDHNDFDNTHYSFYGTKYNVTESSFGSYLMNTCNALKAVEVGSLSEDFFIQFTHQLIQHQRLIFSSIDKLSSLRVSTRKELYRRSLVAREFIDQNICSKISIKQLARIAGLSEVQLHRSFKKIHHSTPYQYQLARKMEYSKELLQAKQHSISEIGLILGFADLPTFSKLFKKYYELSPSTFLKNI